jgi:hypothetical protein
MTAGELLLDSRHERVRSRIVVVDEAAQDSVTVVQWVAAQLHDSPKVTPAARLSDLMADARRS